MASASRSAYCHPKQRKPNRTGNLFSSLEPQIAKSRTPRQDAGHVSTARKCCAGHSYADGLGGLGWFPAPLIALWHVFVKKSEEHYNYYIEPMIVPSLNGYRLFEPAALPKTENK
jgi:hypothetical protein